MGDRIYTVTAERFVAQVSTVAKIVCVNGITYGNCPSEVSYADSLIACDKIESGKPL